MKPGGLRPNERQRRKTRRKAVLLDNTPTFLTTLSFQDLQRLRAVVRQVHMRYYKRRHVTDRECDKLIEAWGPKALEADLRRLVDGERAIPLDRPDKQ